MVGGCLNGQVQCVLETTMGRATVGAKADVIENARYFFGIGDADSFDLKNVDGRAKQLLARGRNFVTLRLGTQLLFVPSRFAGYLRNDFESHTTDDEKNGG